MPSCLPAGSPSTRKISLRAFIYMCVLTARAAAGLAFSMVVYVFPNEPWLRQSEMQVPHEDQLLTRLPTVGDLQRAWFLLFLLCPGAKNSACFECFRHGATESVACEHGQSMGCGRARRRPCCLRAPCAWLSSQCLAHLLRGALGSRSRPQLLARHPQRADQSCTGIAGNS